MATGQLSGQNILALPALQVTMDAAQRRIFTSALRIIVLKIAGALPVLAIPAFVFNAIHIHDSARFIVVPIAVVAAALMVHRSVEGAWAVRGLVAGLLAVTAYDALRMPFVLAGIWPDFIPQLGGWVLGTTGEDVAVGYLWRYLGDGGGMGMVFFLGCAVLGIRRGTVLGRHPVLLGIGYGVFVWSGLVATVALAEAGPSMLFHLTPTSLGLSLAGHLVYGAVLGLYYRRVIDRAAAADGIRRTPDAVPSLRDRQDITKE
jgi:hypothetical protein